MWHVDWARRDKTNLYIVPANRFQEQEFLASQLLPSAVIIDWRTQFLASLRPKQRHMGLTVTGEIERIRQVGNSERQVFAIINTEYFLTSFTEPQRQQFWLALWSDFPHLKGIIILSVLDTAAFLPDKGELENWRNAGRLITFGGLNA